VQKQKPQIAGLILRAAGFLCLAAVAYFAYHYGWTAQRRLTNWRGAVIYCGLPLVLATLSFLSLRLRRRYRTALATCWVLFAVLAYGVEAFLRYSDRHLLQSVQPITSIPRTERDRVAAELTRQYGVRIDTRERAEVIADLRKQGTEAVAQIILPPHESERDTDFQSGLVPLSGIANTVTVACNQNGEYLVYTSDRHGFHNPPEIWQADRIDIATVGNSWTLGYCVPSDQNFVSLIRDRYPATINLGMTGQGPLHVLGVLKEYATFLRPRTVLWFYSEGSSLLELRTGRQSRTLRDYLQNNFSQGLIERQPAVDLVAEVHIARQTAAEQTGPAGAAVGESSLVRELDGFVRLNALRRSLGMVYGAVGASEELEVLSDSELSELLADMNLLRDTFSEASARVRSWGGQLYFVYVPGAGRYFGNPGSGVAKRAEVLESVSMLDIPIIDIYPAFQAHHDPLSLFPFRRTGHANAQGHLLIAETVLAAISSIN
jgi:hypothetical protein